MGREPKKWGEWGGRREGTCVFSFTLPLHSHSLSSFLFWLLPHFSRGQNSEICSPAPRRRLLHRLTKNALFDQSAALWTLRTVAILQFLCNVKLSCQRGTWRTRSGKHGRVFSCISLLLVNRSQLFFRKLKWYRISRWKGNLSTHGLQSKRRRVTNWASFLRLSPQDQTVGCKRKGKTRKGRPRKSVAQVCFSILFTNRNLTKHGIKRGFVANDGCDHIALTNCCFSRVFLAACYDYLGSPDLQSLN